METFILSIIVFALVCVVTFAVWPPHISSRENVTKTAPQAVPLHFANYRGMPPKTGATQTAYVFEVCYAQGYAPVYISAEYVSKIEVDFLTRQLTVRATDGTEKVFGSVYSYGFLLLQAVSLRAMSRQLDADSPIFRTASYF